jgi:hypothetical protein
MIKLSKIQNAVHEQALRLSARYLKNEQELIEILIQVETSNTHKALGKPSLFLYATELLGLTEAVAYALISVARKAQTIPLLREALAKQKISPSKASRIVSALTETNASELIEFAKTHTSKEIDFEVAKRNPKARTRDKIKPLSEDQVQVTVTVDKTTLDKLKRVQSLLAQRNQPATLSDAVSAMSEFYLEAKDPVRKAERAKSRPKPTEELCLNRVPLKAQEKHTVFKRDQGKCTHVDEHGRRCNSDRWIEIHHVQPVSQGGSNHPSNLTTLCSFHHDLVHQQSFPIEGQVTWLRSPKGAYRAL